MSGLFNTVMRIGSVIGVAVFGTAYLALAPGPGRQAGGGRPPVDTDRAGSGGARRGAGGVR